MISLEYYEIQLIHQSPESSKKKHLQIPQIVGAKGHPRPTRRFFFWGGFKHQFFQFRYDREARCEDCWGSGWLVLAHQFSTKVPVIPPLPYWHGSEIIMRGCVRPSGPLDKFHPARGKNGESRGKVVRHP